MSATEYNLVTHWQVPRPVEAVWAELATPEEWPKWWRAVKKVEVIDPGDADGIGAVRRFTWGTALPYSITFDMTATRIEPMRLLEGRPSGEFDGVGRWVLDPQGAGTHVRYDWIVELTRPWMRAFAPALRPAFAWNHRKVMGWGEAGLRRRLGLDTGA